jgi:osmoprotectant transport system ATP-binding protein
LRVEQAPGQLIEHAWVTGWPLPPEPGTLANRKVIALDAVSVHYGSFVALSDVTLSVVAGECLALVGPSGSGKTTALRLMNGLIAADQGSVRVGGRDVKEWQPEELRRSMGYVIQEVGLLPHWSVEQNVATVPKMLGWDPARRTRRARDLIERVGLAAHHLGKLPHELSGGQRQRVGIARALAAEPDTLLMDEPFGAVDPLTRQQLRALLQGLRQQASVTTVLVTHDLGDAFALADRIAVLKDGKIAQLATPTGLQEHPNDEWVRSFVSAGSIPPERAER